MSRINADELFCTEELYFEHLWVVFRLKMEYNKYDDFGIIAKEVKIIEFLI